MVEDAFNRKFLLENFMNYKMSDSRLVMKQYNELFKILGKFAQHTMEMIKFISVSSIIDKLSHSWKDFNYMVKYKKEKLSLVQFRGHLRIGKSLRAQEGVKSKGKEIMESSSINMVKVGESSKII
ncbi:hypothetical protein RND81_06G089400 [Saponaria officinalis]|uniref:Uncharacterized protein n=1 Tax=Saponaria officinalis TaxID=3572 RepID=A0AAW1K8X9_SAPOF